MSTVRLEITTEGSCCDSTCPFLVKERCLLFKEDLHLTADADYTVFRCNDCLEVTMRTERYG